MPPPNDNLANATLLTFPPGGNFPITAGGTNIGATTEAGEPPTSGASVWWKWNTIDPLLGKLRAHTNNLPGVIGSQQTQIPTRLDVFSSTAANPTFAQLTLLGTNFHANGWELQSEVVFQPEIGKWYFFRVDGAPQKIGAPVPQGVILIWLDIAYNIAPRFSDCNGCPPTSTKGGVCLGTWTPAVNQYNEYYVPGSDDGVLRNYAIAYCGGAWLNAPNDWEVIGEAQAIINQYGTFPGQWVGGSWIGAKSHLAGADQFWQLNGDHNAPYPTPSAAEASVGNGCGIAVLAHDGSTKLGLQFIDGDNAVPPNPIFYSDNFVPRGLYGPRFTVFKLTPMLSARGCCGVWDQVTTGKYAMRFTISNDSDFTWGGTATISGPFTVVAGNGQGVSLAGAHTTQLAFTIQLTDPTNKGAHATITLNDSTGVAATLIFDMTPFPTSFPLAGIGIDTFCPAFPMRVQDAVAPAEAWNGMPIEKIRAYVDLTGDVTGIARWDLCAAIPYVTPFGDNSDGPYMTCAPGGLFPFNISTRDSHPATIQMKFTFYDGVTPIPAPPTIITVPLRWR